jgi:hypothetical protein
MMTLIGIGIWGLIIFGFLMVSYWVVIIIISIIMIIYALAQGVYKTLRFLIKGDK